MVCSGLIHIPRGGSTCRCRVGQVVNIGVIDWHSLGYGGDAVLLVFVLMLLVVFLSAKQPGAARSTTITTLRTADPLDGLWISHAPFGQQIIKLLLVMGL
jgi:hypothetical protein